jgi:MutS domain V
MHEIAATSSRFHSSSCCYVFKTGIDSSVHWPTFLLSFLVLIPSIVLAELTSSLAAIPAVRNLSVTAVTSGDNITFLYNVKPGACGQSFGVAVAELARFPPAVVAAAKRKLADLEGHYGAIDAHKRTKHLTNDEEQVGKELVKEFMDVVCQLPLASESDRKASLARARELRLSVISKGNAYVSNILSTI